MSITRIDVDGSCNMMAYATQTELFDEDKRRLVECWLAVHHYTIPIVFHQLWLDGSCGLWKCGCGCGDVIGDFGFWPVRELAPFFVVGANFSRQNR